MMQGMWAHGCPHGCGASRGRVRTRARWLGRGVVEPCLPLVPRLAGATRADVPRDPSGPSRVKHYRRPEESAAPSDSHQLSTRVGGRRNEVSRTPAGVPSRRCPSASKGVPDHWAPDGWIKGPIGGISVRFPSVRVNPASPAHDGGAVSEESQLCLTTHVSMEFDHFVVFDVTSSR